MTRPLSYPLAWSIAVVLAVVAGFGAAVWVGPATHEASAAQVHPSDRVDQVVTSLRSDRFHVTPEMRHLLTEEQVASITRTLAAASHPVHLIYAHDTTDAGYYLASDLLHRVADRLGPGLYVVVDEKMDLTQRDYGLSFGYIDGSDYKLRPADGLLALAETMAGLEVREDDSAGHDPWRGPVGGTITGVLIGTGISMVIGLAVLIGYAVRASRRSRRS